MEVQLISFAEERRGRMNIDYKHIAKQHTPHFLFLLTIRTFQMTVKIKFDFPDPHVFFLYRLEVAH